MAKRKPKVLTKSMVAVLVLVVVTELLAFFQPLASNWGITIPSLIDLLMGRSTVQTAVYPSEGTAEVHFIDVGQANCILIKGSEKTALIDGGEAGTASDVTAYLAAKGVTTIDYFFNTHPHADHMGGCKSIMEAVPTGEFIMPQLSKKAVPTTTGYKKLLTYLDDNKDSITVVTAEVGNDYDLGGGLYLTVTGPVELYDDLNNTSLVIRMDFGKTSFLFTGDMETQSQEDMLRSGAVSRVNLLSAPHHGSNSSIDKGFMRAITPQISVISCGVDNDYGHPHPETLKLYEDMGIEYFRTDMQGSIVAITDGEEIVVTTEREA